MMFKITDFEEREWKRQTADPLVMKIILKSPLKHIFEGNTEIIINSYGKWDKNGPGQKK